MHWTTARAVACFSCQLRYGYKYHARSCLESLTKTRISRVIAVDQTRTIHPACFLCVVTRIYKLIRWKTILAWKYLESISGIINEFVLISQPRTITTADYSSKVLNRQTSGKFTHWRLPTCMVYGIERTKIAQIPVISVAYIVQCFDMKSPAYIIITK